MEANELLREKDLLLQMQKKDLRIMANQLFKTFNYGCINCRDRDNCKPCFSDAVERWRTK